MSFQTSEREALWQQELEKFRQEQQQRNRHINPDLLETEVVLNLLGVRTFDSSIDNNEVNKQHMSKEDEGDNEEGNDENEDDNEEESDEDDNEEDNDKAPLLSLRVEKDKIMNNRVEEAYKRANECSRQARELRKQERVLFKEAHQLAREAKTQYVQSWNKIMVYLTAFYEQREVPYDRLLVIDIMGRTGNAELGCQGMVLFGVLAPEERQQKQQEYWEEIRAFTTFLKNVYFSQEQSTEALSNDTLNLEGGSPS